MQCSAVAPPHGQQRLSVCPFVGRPRPESLQNRKKRNEWPWPLTERERKRERERSSPLSDDGLTLTVTCGRPLAPLYLPPSLPLSSLSECLSLSLSLCWSVCLSPLRVLSASLPASRQEDWPSALVLPASCATTLRPPAARRRARAVPSSLAGWLPRWDLGARLCRTRKLFETERNIVCGRAMRDAKVLWLTHSAVSPRLKVKRTMNRRPPSRPSSHAAAAPLVCL